MRKKKAGIAFVGIGAVLILLALLLFLYNERRNAVMEQANQDIYDELQDIIRQASDTEGNVTDEDPDHVEILETEETQPPETNINTAASVMKIATLNGYDYIGILEIPILELALPVLSDWDEEKLDIAPCRHFGSVKTDDLVIAGHNYRRHFLYLYKLTVGDTVCFTDMDGTVIEYEVAEKRTLQATDVDAVLESEYDLVLYTCTYSGTERTAIFCQRINQE